MIPTTQTVMLAAPSKNIHPEVATALELLSNGRYYFDLKWDGVRALALLDNGKVTLVNRRGAIITPRYPELVEALRKEYPQGTYAFDGEVICLGTDGKPDFARIHRRDAFTEAPAYLVKATPATYVAFDMLWAGEEDLRDQPFEVRLATLRKYSANWDGVSLVRSLGSIDGPTMWSIVQEHSLEGLVAKTLNGRYTGRRDPSWVKLKPTQRISAVVMGYEPGEGSRSSTFGALKIGLITRDAGKVGIQPIGKVGSGFTQRDLDDLLPRLTAGEVLVVEVEYQEVSPNGQLRFPVFRGVRNDIELVDCTTDQINA